MAMMSIPTIKKGPTADDFTKLGIHPRDLEFKIINTDYTNRKIEGTKQGLKRIDAFELLSTPSITYPDPEGFLEKFLKQVFPDYIGHEAKLNMDKATGKVRYDGSVLRYA